MTDRLAEIRARLDAASKSAVRSWERWPTYDDLMMREPFPTNEQAALAAHAPADIAWLLDEVERLRAIDRPVRFPYGKPDTGAF